MMCCFATPRRLVLLVGLACHVSHRGFENDCTGCCGTGVVLNNVNACGGNTALLQPDSIASIGQTLEPIFQKWGLRLYLSPCYAAPLVPGMGLPVRITTFLAQR